MAGVTVDAASSTWLQIGSAARAGPSCPGHRPHDRGSIQTGDQEPDTQGELDERERHVQRCRVPRDEAGEEDGGGGNPDRLVLPGGSQHLPREVGSDMNGCSYRAASSNLSTASAGILDVSLRRRIENWPSARHGTVWCALSNCGRSG